MQKGLILLIVFNCFYVLAQAQQRIALLKGKLVDAATGAPVAGASIQVENSAKYAFSGQNGAFEIQEDSALHNQYLVVFHINYEPHRQRIETGKALVIALTPKQHALPEITISARKKNGPEKVVPTAVVDYAVLPRHLLLLQRVPKQPFPVLQLVDNQDSLLLSFDLPMAANTILKDCFGNFHLATADSVFQAILLNEQIVLYPAIALTDYRKILEPCVAATLEKAYFRQQFYSGLIVSYFSMQLQPEARPKLLRSVQDGEAMAMMQDEPRFQLMKARAGMIRTAHDRDNSIRFMQQVLCRPPYVPLLKIGEELCLFNHLQHRLEFYHNDSLVRLVPVRYHLQKNWHEQILVDEEAQQPYVVFEKGGTLELHALDLKNGSLRFSYKLPVSYPKRLEVHNGILYFLYREPERGFRQHLFRKKLS